MTETERLIAVAVKKHGERVVVMIDRSNLDSTWRQIEGASGNKLDYIKLRDLLVQDRMLRQVRLYYSEYDFEVLTNDTERAEWQKRRNFYTYLRHQGFWLYGLRRRLYDGVGVEKGLDAAIIADFDRLCRDGRCDTLILVAGDADYCGVVREAQDRYCVNVEVVFFHGQTSGDLQFGASKFVDLGCVRDKIYRTWERKNGDPS